jgi:hydrogenase expression/formation protein HypC
MCLAVPGRVVRWLNRDATFAQAEVEFEGVRRVCHMACVPDAEEGEYVIVHAGVAINRLNEDEARQTLEDFARLGELDASLREASAEETT